jgi:hypothetical protein
MRGMFSPATGTTFEGAPPWPLRRRKETAGLAWKGLQRLCHISEFYLLLLSSRRELGYAIPMP